MMDSTLTGDQISLFLLVLARVSGLILSAPVLGEAQVPRMVKVTLVIACSLLLVQTPAIGGARVPAGLGPFTLGVLSQLAIGIALGFTARMIFFAVQAAGSIVSLQMGLNVGAVISPLSREPDPILSQLYTVIAVLTFLAVDGDLWLLAALSRSFDLAAIGLTSLPAPTVQGVIGDALAVTQLGAQIALPIAASLLAANLVLGVVSRSVPQLNLFMLSMPLGMLLGLMALLGSLAALLVILGHLFSTLPQSMLQILR